MSATCIIIVDNNRKFYTGYCIGDYDGSQEVDILQSGFEKLRDAQLVVENGLVPRPHKWRTICVYAKLLNSGIKETRKEN